MCYGSSRSSTVRNRLLAGVLVAIVALTVVAIPVIAAPIAVATDSPERVGPGESFELVYELTNDGDEATGALGLNVTELPSVLEVTEIRSDQGTPAEERNAIFWIDPVDPGETVGVTFEFVIAGDAPAGELEITAEIASDDYSTTEETIVVVEDEFDDEGPGDDGAPPADDGDNEVDTADSDPPDDGDDETAPADDGRTDDTVGDGAVEPVTPDDEDALPGDRTLHLVGAGIVTALALLFGLHRWRSG